MRIRETDNPPRHRSTGRRQPSHRPGSTSSFVALPVRDCPCSVAFYSARRGGGPGLLAKTANLLGHANCQSSSFVMAIFSISSGCCSTVVSGCPRWVRVLLRRVLRLLPRAKWPHFRQRAPYDANHRARCVASRSRKRPNRYHFPAFPHCSEGPVLVFSLPRRRLCEKPLQFAVSSWLC